MMGVCLPPPMNPGGSGDRMFVKKWIRNPAAWTTRLTNESSLLRTALTLPTFASEEQAGLTGSALFCKSRIPVSARDRTLRGNVFCPAHRRHSLVAGHKSILLPPVRTRASFYVNATQNMTDENRSVERLPRHTNVSAPYGISTPNEPNISSTR